MTFEELLVMVADAAPKQDWKVTVPIDQISDTSVSSIIRRATSGQPILGNPNQVYDGHERTDQVNPLNNMGFDLDDLINTAKENNQTIKDLTNELNQIEADKLSTSTTEASDPTDVK